MSWSPWRLDQHPRGLPVHPSSHLKQEQGQGLASATSLKARGHLSHSHGVAGGETEAWGRGASRELAAELVGAELGACQAEAPLLSPLETWPWLEPEVAFLSRLPGHLWSPMATSPSPQLRKSQSSGLELKRALDSEAGRGETSEAAAWGPGGLGILSWTSSRAGLTLVIKQRWQEIPGFIFPGSSSGWWGSPLGGPAWVPGGPRVTPRSRQPLPWPPPPSPCPLSTGSGRNLSHPTFWVSWETADFHKQAPRDKPPAAQDWGSLAAILTFFFLIFFSKKNYYWRIADLQCFHGVRCTTK